MPFYAYYHLACGKTRRARLDRIVRPLLPAPFFFGARARAALLFLSIIASISMLEMLSPCIGIVLAFAIISHGSFCPFPCTASISCARALASGI